jgi:hypothetical protein
MCESGCSSFGRFLVSCLVLFLLALPTTSHAALPGDCNKNGAVSIDEVQYAINSYLGLNTVLPCIDLNGGSSVEINEVQAVINSYLGLTVPGILLGTQSASVGQALAVAITGIYSDFVQGVTTADFGPAISVGGGEAGAAGPVTVTSPTSALAQLVIGPTAATGARIVTVATGAQQLKAVFTVTPSPAASIAAFSGTPQSVQISKPFPAPLVAVVKDAANQPVAGMVVTFTAPASGASGTFVGGVNTAVTDAAGLATAPQFTANSSTGAYAVTASVAGVAATASFALENLPAATPPASMTLTLSQGVVNAGGSITFTDKYFDATGTLITPAPVSNCSISTGAATGTLPAIVAKNITTSADSRGTYTLTCALAGTTLTKSVDFVVIAPTGTPTSEQSGLYGNLSVQLGQTSTSIDNLATALANGQNGAIQGIFNTMKAARDAVNLVALQRSTAFAPEAGFPPTPAVLTARGFGPGPNDANFNAVANNLIAKLQELTAFVNSITAQNLSDATGTQMAQLNAQLQTLLTQFRTFAPTLNGVVSSSGYLNKLLADSIPVFQRAQVTMIERVLKGNGLIASATNPTEMYAALGVLGSERSPQPVPSPEEYYANIQPAFFGLVDLMMGSSIQGQLINMMYGEAFRYLENAMITLAAESLLAQFINNATLDGIITGASLSIHIFYAPGSVIEGNAINPIASRNDVLLVGPNQVNAVRGLLEAFVPGDMDNLDDIYNYFEGIVDAIQGAGESYDEAHQPPDAVYPYSCILGGGDACSSASYNNGFGSVYTCSGWLCLPAPVIVIIHNLDTGEWAWGIYNFMDA